MTHHNPPPEAEELLRTGEVGVMFRVDPRTVRRWVEQGKFRRVIYTPGGQRRYPAALVRELLQPGARP